MNEGADKRERKNEAEVQVFKVPPEPAYLLILRALRVHVEGRALERSARNGKAFKVWV